MALPGEELISVALEKFSDGILQKMDQAEERRNREFAYKLKELEFYKGNYDKEIKAIFDYWFELLQVALLSGNKNIERAVSERYQKRFRELNDLEKVFKMKIMTMKYCGTETGKILALYSRLLQPDFSEKPDFSPVYVICLLLSTLKKEVLGQELDPLYMLQILLNDYDKSIEKISESKQYIDELLQEWY